MDSNSGTGATPSSGMTQAQADNLSRIGIPTELINEIYHAKLPDNVLSKLATVTSPQQLVDEVGTLWLSSDLVERIKRVGTPARVEQPPMAATPPAQQPAQPQYNYGQPTQPTPAPYGQAPQQGAPPPGYQYPQQQQGYPQQQQGYPPAGYPQPYPAAAAPVKKGGVPAIVWVLGGVLLTIVLCVVGVMVAVGALGNAVVGAVNTAGALATAEGFSTSLSAGSYDSAHDLLSGDIANRYSVATLQTKWEALVGADSGFSTNADFGTPRSDGNRVIVPWTIEGQNGKSYKVDLYISSLTSSSNSDSVLQIVDAKPDLIPAP